MDHKRSYPRTINVIVPTIIDDICDRPIGTDRVSLGIRSYQVFEISIDDYKVTTAIPIHVKETYSCLSFLNTEIVIHHLLPLTLFEPKIQRLFLSISTSIKQQVSKRAILLGHLGPIKAPFLPSTLVWDLMCDRPIGPNHI